MKSIYSVIFTLALTLLLTSNANAADEFLGTWSYGAKEVLNITKKGEALSAEFIRENVKSEFEEIRFPAKVENGELVITGEQGDLSAKYDTKKKRLVLGGMKEFQRLTKEQAELLIANLKK